MRSDTATIYLVRHAQSAPDFGIAECDWPLSPNGSLQALRLAAHLGHLGATQLISSPYRRAAATLEPYSHKSGLPIRIEADLRERHLRDGYVENWQEFMHGIWSDIDSRMPNCESGTECQRRVTRCLTLLAEEFPGETLVLTSHGNAIALFLKEALDARMRCTSLDQTRDLRPEIQRDRHIQSMPPCVATHSPDLHR